MKSLNTFHKEVYGFGGLLLSMVQDHICKKVCKLIQEKNFNCEFFSTWIVTNEKSDKMFACLSNLGEVTFAEGDSGNRFCYVIGDDFVASFSINNIVTYQEMHVGIYTNYNNKSSVENRLLECFKSFIVDCSGFVKVNVDWYSFGEHLEHREVTEVFDDRVYPEAYPYLPLNDFVKGYLSSNSSVLILFGMQGTGKTRLIRHIVQTKGKMTGADLKVLYTADIKAMADESLFIEFRCREYDFMVLEDIDNYLISRSEGNNVMHKFLAASDGFLASKRKIILSTNLNIGDVDSALVRPGRCYASIEMRKLNRNEAEVLLSQLLGEGCEELEDKEYSLAEVYNIAFKTSSNVFMRSRKVGF